MITEILHDAIKISREEDYAGKKKTSFWASESETMAFEIYHRWMETEPTNPITEEKLMMLKMRKLTEEAVVHYLRKSGKMIERLTNEERVYFEWGKHKVPVSGYPDTGILVGNEEILIEVKTYYGGHNHSQVRNGYVKSAYLKQLAIYMLHHKIKHGILLLINQGTGEMFEFDLYNEGGKYKFVCPDNEQVIDLEDTFKRWETIWVNNIQKKVEPEIEFQYKYDLKLLKWDELKKSQISGMRTNKAVLGDWQVKFSDFKNLIVEKQGTHLGYNDEEIEYIKSKTEGYSTTGPGKVKFNPEDL
ncbi:MAG: hypothetical protein HOG49_13520 [Candidatus Scalindua sp.]|jgi:hypothetical protein|nr:hypothetical protein [Candidatus Scalindua sp.]